MSGADEAERRRSGSLDRPSRGRFGVARFWLAIIIALAGCAVSVVVWQALLAHERQLARMRFKLDAEQRIRSIERRVRNDTEAVHFLSAFFAGSEKVTRDQFRTFARPVLSRYRAIQALEWLPRVVHDERAEHEAALVEEGFPDYRILDAASDGSLLPAPHRDEYFPVTFIEPLETNRSILGLDRLSTEVCRAAIRRARETGRVTVSGYVGLAHEPDNPPGLLVLGPLYREEARNDAAAQGEKRLLGMVAVVMRIDTMVEEALSYFPSAGIDVTILDETAKAPRHVLYASSSPQDSGASKPDEPSATAGREARQHAVDMELPGRRWLIRCTPGDRYVVQGASQLPLVALVSGLAISVLLALYVHGLQSRTAVVERLAERLEDTNTWLQREIAEREQAEAALLRTQDELELRVRQRTAELERSNADLEQFAYVVSHDLQEPLRMVTSYLQLLAKRYGGHLDEKADTYIEFAVDGARRMQQLICDLLSYSRVGRRGGAFGPVDFSQVADEAIENLRATIEEHRGEVIHKGLPAVRGDHTQLVQLTQNLISNALKFHGEEPPRVCIAAEKSEGEWTFSVRDNGIGIDRKHQQRVFKIFQRLHTRDQYPGTGVGLAICERIVDRHQGRIWFDSEVGRGTTFYFTLPDATGPQEPARRA